MIEFIENLSRKKQKSRESEPVDGTKKEEVKKARKEASEIVKALGLKERPYKPFGLDDKDVYEPTWDTRIILEVPKEIFPELIAQKGISCIYWGDYPGDGSRLADLWFVTDSKLRVRTKTSKSDPFVKDIVDLSSLAQGVELAGLIGDRKVSVEDVKNIYDQYPEEWERISIEKGFNFYDHVTSKWVYRVRLLPAEEVEKYKELLIEFKMGQQPEG